MKRLSPRILPLVGVALGGALAVKALSTVPIIFAANAVAAPVQSTATARPAAPPPAPVPTVARAPLPAPICARSPAELARDAGLSPAELQTLQNLGARRGQLDARETALDSQLQLINAAAIKLDAKLKGLSDLKAQIQGLLTQADEKTAAETDKLVSVYEKMKPRDAGALMATLDDKVRVPVAARIAETKPAVLAAILSQMGTLEGKKLTELLAHRFQPNVTLVQAMASGVAAAAAVPPAADASAPAPEAKATKLPRSRRARPAAHQSAKLSRHPRSKAVQAA